MTLNKNLIWILVISMPHIFQAAPKEEMKERNMNIIKKTDWQVRTNDVLGIAKQLEIREAVYRFQIKPDYAEDITVIAFKPPRSLHGWIGLRMDFYIDTKTKIIGGSVSGGIVRWCESRDVQFKNIGATIDRFEKNVDSKLMQSCKGIPATDLRGVLRRSFLTRHGTTTDAVGANLNIKSVAKEEGKVRLDLEHPFTKKKASVWIDLKTMKAVKAVQDGEQVFPK